MTSRARHVARASCTNPKRDRTLANPGRDHDRQDLARCHRRAARNGPPGHTPPGRSCRSGLVIGVSPYGGWAGALNPAVFSSNSSWRPRRQPWPAPGGRCSDFRFSSLCVNRVGVRGTRRGALPQTSLAPVVSAATSDREPAGGFGCSRPVMRPPQGRWLLVMCLAVCSIGCGAFDSAVRSVEGGCFVVRGR